MFNNNFLYKRDLGLSSITADIGSLYQHILYSVYRGATNELNILFDLLIVIPENEKITIHYFEVDMSNRIELPIPARNWKETIACIENKFRNMYGDYFLALVEMPSLHKDNEYYTFVLLRWQQEFVEKERVIPIFLNYIIKNFISMIYHAVDGKIIIDARKIIQDGLNTMLDDIGDSYCNFCSTIVDDLSTQMYEKGIGSGSIIMAREHIQCDISIQKVIHVWSNSLREIRKLLEISDKNLSLVFCGCKECTSHMFHPKLIGFAVKNKINDEKIKLRFIINGYMEWGIEYQSEIICQSVKRNLIIPHKKIDERKLKLTFINDLYCDIQSAEKLCNIVNLAAQQSHGTSLIISNKKIIESEVCRLCDANRGYKIIPIDLSSKEYLKYIKHITSIDGAVLIDTSGHCYALGVILDGKAIIPGETARGARYNSIKNYIAWKKTELTQNSEQAKVTSFVGIIISEDETIDIITTNAINLFEV